MMRPQPSPLHPGYCRLHAVEHRGQVDGDDRVPAFSGKILDIGDKLDAGIVHQDVQRAKLRLSFPHHRGDLVRLRDVGP